MAKSEKLADVVKDLRAEVERLREVVPAHQCHTHCCCHGYHYGFMHLYTNPVYYMPSVTSGTTTTWSAGITSLCRRQPLSGGAGTGRAPTARRSPPGGSRTARFAMRK